MTARAISIEAYHRHIESGKALVQWAEIYEHLRTNVNIRAVNIGPD
jgi:hypothetical protein